MNQQDKPDGWAVATLGDTCLVVQGQSPPGSTYNTDAVGLPFLQGKAEFGDIYPDTVKWCSAPSKIAEPDDVLISVRAPVGPTNLCAIQSCIGRGLAAIRPGDSIPSKYVLYLLRATEDTLRAKATGTTFAAIKGDDLRSHVIPFPPLPEQRRIVAEIETQFTRLDASVAALRRTRANLKRYRASVLRAACSGELVPTEAELARAEGREYEPASVLLERILAERRAHWDAQEKRRGKYKEPAAPDTSDLPPLPEGWVWATVDACLSGIQAGKNFKCEERPPGEAEHGVVKVSSVTWGEFDSEESKTCHDLNKIEPRLMIKPGDFLFSRANTLQLVGACVIVRSVTRNLMLSDKILRFSVVQVPNEWLLCFLRSAFGRNEIERLATGNQESMRNIGQDRIRQIRLPLPPFAEQRRIVAEVERRLSVIQQAETAVEASLQRAERLRQSILKRAFSGELVPQDPDDEPASVLLERIRAQRKAEQSAAATAKKRPARRRREKAAAQNPTREEAAA